MPHGSTQAKPKRNTKKPLQKATVTVTAREPRNQSASNIDKRILERIQKCLNRAHHANTTESEAKAALFLSQKLMSQHNVTQADLMAADKNESKAHYGGRSIVSITKVAGSSSRVTRETFVHNLATAMCTLFDCKSFSTDLHSRIEWTFFGIAENTVASAMGFEMAHNKILDWACAYKGGSSSNSYRIGVADGLKEMARLEKRKELTDAKRKELDLISAREREEEQERQRELDRLRSLPPTCASNHSSTSDSEEDSVSMKPDPDLANLDSDNEPEMDEIGVKADFDAGDVEIIDLCDDVDEAIERFIKQEPTEPVNPSEIPRPREEPETKIKTEPNLQPDPVISPWDSGMQLVQFRATAEQVADDYLKRKNIKLRKSRKRSSYARDIGAYLQGQRDSAKIKIRRTEE